MLTRRRWFTISSLPTCNQLIGLSAIRPASRDDGIPLHHFSNNVALTDAGEGNSSLVGYHQFLRLAWCFCQRFFPLCRRLARTSPETQSHVSSRTDVLLWLIPNIKPRAFILMACYVMLSIMTCSAAKAQASDMLATLSDWYAGACI